MYARCCLCVPPRCLSLFVCYCAAKKPTLYYRDMHPVSLIGEVWVPRQQCTCSYRTLNREPNKRRLNVRKQTWCRNRVALYCSHTCRQPRRLPCAARRKRGSKTLHLLRCPGMGNVGSRGIVAARGLQLPAQRQLVERRKSDG